MATDFRERMTNDMKKVYDETQDIFEAECLYCQEKLKEANRAIDFHLPHENEEGLAVFHGCVMQIHSIARYWYSRMNLASDHVSREFYDKHDLYNRYIK